MGFYFVVQIKQDSAHIDTMLICNFRPSQMHINLLNLLFSTVISDQTLQVISSRVFCKKAIVTPLHQTPSISLYVSHSLYLSASDFIRSTNHFSPKVENNEDGENCLYVSDDIILSHSSYSAKRHFGS